MYHNKSKTYLHKTHHKWSENENGQTEENLDNENGLQNSLSGLPNRLGGLYESKENEDETNDQNWLPARTWI